MTKTRVYIVNWRDYYSGGAVFRKVFFTKEAAVAWIAEAQHPEDYEIETFEEAENGESKEIYD